MAKPAIATTNPLLTQFDAELHELTEKMRQQHPAYWFSYTSASVVERGKAKEVPPAKTASPLTAQYVADMDAITAKFNSKYPDWVFSYKGAKVEALMKGGKVEHNTRPLAPTK